MIILAVLFALNLPVGSRGISVTVREISSYNGGRNESFLDIEGAAFHTDGSLYVSDKLGYHVVHLAPDGTVIAQTGGRGSSPGRFMGPGPISCARKLVAVADFASSRVQLFSCTLEYVTGFSFPGPVFDMHHDPKGGLWIGGHGESVRAILAKYDSAGHESIRISPRNATGDLFSDVFRFCIAADGLLYVAYHTQNVIEVWNGSGTFLRAFGIPGLALQAESVLMETPWSASPLKVPLDNLIRDVAIDSHNSLYLLCDGPAKHPLRDVVMLTSQGGFIAMFTLPEAATSIWFSPDGTLFAATGNRQTLRRYALSINTR